MHSNPTPGVAARIYRFDTPNNAAPSPTSRPTRPTSSTLSWPAAPHRGGSAAQTSGRANQTIPAPAPTHHAGTRHTEPGRAGTPIERPAA